ncbi:hypothetical protein JTB14_009182 [Gonioctena quinquepunctata]|nr:hypothetical protein JTB14_009182 [Gonioctena quinquepunctata]
MPAFHIARQTGRGFETYKAHVSLFIKAIHLELVSDLSIDAFIAALKRFASEERFQTPDTCSFPNWPFSNIDLREKLHERPNESSVTSRGFNNCDNTPEKMVSSVYFGTPRPTKWRENKFQLKVDDLVLIKEFNLSPPQWKLGRVTKLYYGSDNSPRVVR